MPAARFRSLLIAGLITIVACALAFLSWHVRQNAQQGAPAIPVDPDAVFMPAEFDSQEFLLLGGTQLIELCPSVLVDMIRTVHTEVQVVVLVGSVRDRQKIEGLLAENGLPAGAVEFLYLPIRTMWVRDFGPVTVVDGSGGRRMIDFHYRERRGNTLDDTVPEHVAAYFGLPRISDGLLLEGGDFLTNGRGLCLGSTRFLARNEHYLRLEARHVVEGLAARLGFEEIVLLDPLQGETTGHLDMFCALLAPDLCVVGQFDHAVDEENADLLDQNAARLAQQHTLDGPLRVARIPMPPHEDDIWRSYTNVVFAGGILLVPVYPDCCPDLDAAALEIYRHLLPDRMVVGIDASQLVGMRGVLRCITMNVPRGGRPGS